MYFQFLRFCIILGVILFLCSGIPNIIINSQGNACIPKSQVPADITYDQLIKICVSGYVTDYSLANQSNNHDKLRLEGGINLITIALLIIVLQKLRTVQRRTAIQCDEREITASDFTARVYNLPTNFSDSEDIDHEILKFFVSNGCPGRQLNVKKVNPCYDCSEKLFLKKIIEEKTIEKIKLLAEKDHGMIEKYIIH
jgi:hypothetical protein